MGRRQTILASCVAVLLLAGALLLFSSQEGAAPESEAAPRQEAAPRPEAASALGVAVPAEQQLRADAPAETGGRVVRVYEESGGAPIAAAKVFAADKAQAYYAASELRPFGVTDGKGLLPLKSMEPGKILLAVHQGYATGCVMASGNLAVLDISMRKGVGGTFRFRTADGGLVENASIVLSPTHVLLRSPFPAAGVAGPGVLANWHAVSGKDGLATLTDMLPGPVVWRVYHASYCLISVSPPTFAEMPARDEVVFTMAPIVGAHFQAPEPVLKWGCVTPEGLDIPGLAADQLIEMRSAIEGQNDPRCKCLLFSLQPTSGHSAPARVATIRILTQLRGWSDISVAIRPIDELSVPETVLLGPAPAIMPTRSITLTTAAVDVAVSPKERVLLTPTNPGRLQDSLYVEVGSSQVVPIDEYTIRALNPFVDRVLRDRRINVTQGSSVIDLGGDNLPVLKLLFADSAGEPMDLLTGMVRIESGAIARTFQITGARLLTRVSAGDLDVEVMATGYKRVQRRIAVPAVGSETEIALERATRE